MLNANKENWINVRTGVKERIKNKKEEKEENGLVDIRPAVPDGVASGLVNRSHVGPPGARWRSKVVMLVVKRRGPHSPMARTGLRRKTRVGHSTPDG